MIKSERTGHETLLNSIRATINLKIFRLTISPDKAEVADDRKREMTDEGSCGHNFTNFMIHRTMSSHFPTLLPLSGVNTISLNGRKIQFTLKSMGKSIEVI